MDEKFQFKKKFGQNFLKNEKVLTRIVDVEDISQIKEIQQEENA